MFYSVYKWIIGQLLVCAAALLRQEETEDIKIYDDDEDVGESTNNNS